MNRRRASSRPLLQSTERAMTHPPGNAAVAGAACVVLGAGSWGTALAIQLARVAQPTVLWGRDADHLEHLRQQRRNARYLPDAPFPTGLQIESDLATAVRCSRDIVVAVPSHALRETLQAVAPLLDAH